MTEPSTLTLAGWARQATESGMQAILETASRPDAVSFALGLPDPALFEAPALARAAAAAVATPGALQYGPPSARLKSHIVGLMAARGVACRPEEIFLTTGSQQGLGLLAWLLLDAGGAIVTDELTYPGILQVTAPLRPDVRTVPVTAGSGTDVAALEALLAGGLRPAFIYAMPDGHNPIGANLSADQRLRLVALAARHRVPIIEDDPYGLLAYEPAGLPLRALDPRWVIYVGTLSKVVAPALRIGWLVAPEAIVARLSAAKEAADLNVASTAQHIAAAYLDGEDMVARCGRARAIYHQRREVTLAALERHLAPVARWTVPQAGFCTWVELPERVSIPALLARCIEESVVFLPGAVCAASPHLPRAQHALRLAFSACAIDRIDDGIARLARGVQHVLGGPARRPRVLEPVDTVIAGWATAAPDHAAVVHGEGVDSYAQLMTRVAALAARLAAAGVGPEHRAGVLLGRGPALVPALLAVLQTGASYLALDPGAPAMHLAAICRDAGLTCVVTEPATRHLVPDDLAVLDVASLDDRGAPPAPPRSLDDLAYLVYTSGTTGAAKGVMIPHRALRNHVRAVSAAYALSPDDRVLQFASIGFDVAAEEIFATLYAGATLVLAEAWHAMAFDELSPWLAARGVTVVNLPASFWRAWLGELALGRATVPACLRLVIVGSEAVRRDDWQRWHELVDPRVRLVNAYGPSEATITATVFDGAGALPPGHGSSVPIGRPIAGVSARVLSDDDQYRELPDGEPGMLYLGGLGLARGYLGRPALTAAAFVPDRFAGAPGARLYRTGDRVVRDPDGTFELLGRADRQAKIRGHRIELDGVEAVLRACPGLRDAAVVARADRAGEPELIAVCVADAAEPVAAELRAFVAQRLPAGAVPVAFVMVARLPLLASGKLDRPAVVALATREARPRRAAPPPATDVERAIARVVEEVLGLAAAEISLADSFHDHGGQSLSAMRAVARLRERLHVELSVHQLVEAPSLAALAALIEQLPRVVGATPEILPRPARIPLSFPQEQVWLTQQLAPDSVAYTAPTVIHLRGRLDVAALERSIDALVERHEVLRTTFPADDGSPVQRIHPVGVSALSRIDLEGLAAPDRQAALDRQIAETLAEPFDLARLPLMRWHLVRLDAGEHVLVVVEHHLVHDGWSTNVLFGELFQLYAAFARSQPSPLPALTLAFADFVVWHRRWLAGGEGDRQLRYWTDKLAGVDTWLNLPYDFARPARRRFRGSAQRMTLSAELTGALQARSRDEGVTLFSFLLASYVVLLHRYSGQADFCVGTGVANRRWQACEGVVGMLINTIALRAELTGELTFRDVLRRIRALTIEAAGNQDVPLERIVDALHLERDPSRNPLFQVIFGLHDAPLDTVELPELDWSLLESPSNGSAKFDLGLIVIPRPETARGWSSRLGDAGLTLIWEFDRDLFEPRTIARMRGQFLTLMAAALADPGAEIARLPLDGPADRARTLSEGRGPALEVHGVAIHQRFAAHAGTSPAAPAVRSRGATLSYGELERAANQLAHHLRARGVRRGDIVGLWGDRSAPVVIGMLGILKAGAAYLPLDRSYPAERLAWMVADAGATVLVAETRAADTPEIGGTVLVLDELAEVLARQPGSPPAVTTTADDRAYVMYTSGSTGVPKGVVIPHRGVVRLVVSRGLFPIGPGDRVAQLASLGFDASTLEIWGALLNRAELCMLGRETALSPAALEAAIHDQQLTTMFVATALLNQLVAARPGMFAGLRELMFGAEAVNPASIAQLLRCGAPARLLHLYGPTECTTIATWQEIREVADRALTLPIGRPHDGTTVRVLDAALRPVAIGVTGELYVGGDGLAHGYLRRPGLTAERFVPDPSPGAVGARLYATGDRVRYRPDGALEFVGRSDGQVKIRGVRVEPGEIEAVLARHSAVREAVVTPRDDATGARRLVAYVVPYADGVRPEPRALEAWLHGRLPPALVPDAVVVLDHLPLTANGKLDRRALPLPVRDAEPATPAVAATAEQRAVMVIWCELLGVARVGAHDSFFQLGGHSLLAIQMLARVEAELGVAPPIAAFFEAPSVAALADAVADQLTALEQMSEAEAERLLANPPGAGA